MWPLVFFVDLDGSYLHSSKEDQRWCEGQLLSP